jgi:hypothetical protein
MKLTQLIVLLAILGSASGAFACGTGYTGAVTKIAKQQDSKNVINTVYVGKTNSSGDTRSGR